MKYNLKVCLFLFCMLFLMAVCPQRAVCSATEQAAVHVWDNAGFFSDDEIQDLEAICIKYGDLSEANIIFLIENGVKNKAWKEFLEKYYDANEEELGDCVEVLLDLNKEERHIEIQGYGEMEYIVSDNRIDEIINEILGDLKNGDYYDALEAIPPMVYDYYTEGRAEDARTHTQADNEKAWADNRVEKTDPAVYFLICIPIALAIGGVSVGVMAYQSGGRVTTNHRSYQDAGSRGLIGRYDRYTHTTTTRRQKPKDPPPDMGGSSGGGVSSGGNSHSGGGASF